MATLTVRQLTLRDLLSIRNARQRQERADLPLGWAVRGPDNRAILASGVPNRFNLTRGFVAQIDDEICGYLILGQHSIVYRWDIVALGVGSPRLEASDEVSVELWVALLEFAIKEVGSLGARRLYANAVDGTTLHASLLRAGFSGYTRLALLHGHPSQLPDIVPVGFREQYSSDIWSIHQLYHRSTPPAVQFSEALTSDEWELPEQSWLDRVAMKRQTQYGFVLETSEGVGGYCRITRRGNTMIVSFLANVACIGSAVNLVGAAVNAVGADDRDEIIFVVPGFIQEAVSGLQACGVRLECEYVSMVRHTTVPMVVHPDLMPATANAEARRRARGVLSGARRTHVT